MGFFSKIFGGKKADTGELETVSGEQPVVEDSQPHKVDPETESIPEEDRVPEPEPQSEAEARAGSDNKSTVFGMPAPVFSQRSATTSGEIASGELSSGEMELGGGSEEPARSEFAGSMVVGGEVTLGQTSSGEIELGEISVAAPVVRSEPEDEGAPADAASSTAAPAGPAPATDSGALRASGARPAILDDDDHSDVDLFPKAADQKDLRSSIECGACHRKLPVPYVGYPARITCPFCLNANEYNM